MLGYHGVARKTYIHSIYTPQGGRGNAPADKIYVRRCVRDFEPVCRMYYYGYPRISESEDVHCNIIARDQATESIESVFE